MRLGTERTVSPPAGLETGPPEPPGQGERALSLRFRRALVVLFLLPSLLAILAVVAVVIDQRHQQAEQARQSRIVEHRVCVTFAHLAALKPPAGNPATNPSRAYLQKEHSTLVRLGSDLGCGKSGR